MGASGHKISRQFRFDPTKIRQNFVDRHTWHDFIRSSEIDLILSLIGDRRFERTLEIGAGDGFHCRYLASRSNELICVDIDRTRWDNRQGTNLPPNVSFVATDASDLSSYSDGSFDLVYSANVLEHIEEMDRCLKEIHRVLEPSGIGIHSVPSRYWKFFNSLSQMCRFRKARRWIHGTESTNWKEYIAWGLTNWIRKFSEAGFEIEEIYGMPFYFGGLDRWRTVVECGNRCGFPSSFTFFLRPGRERS